MDVVKSVKSVIYLIGFSGLGYALMKILVQDKNYDMKESAYKTDASAKRQAIVDVIRMAAGSEKPMYRQTKEEIDTTRDQYLVKKEA